MNPVETPPRGPRRRYFIVTLVVLLLLLFLYLIRPILMGIVIGILLWALTRGLFEGILKRVKGRRGLAGGLSFIAPLLLVIVPLVVIITLMAADATTLGEKAQQWFGPLQPQIMQGIERISHGRSVYLFGIEITAQQIRERAAEVSARMGQFLLGLVQKTASGVLQFAITLFVALYTLYFFYLDGERFLSWIKRILPLAPAQSDALIQSFFSTSIATIKMLGVIGVVQGLACGAAFWIAGAPAVFFLTVAAAIASLIPSLGTGLVFIPVAIGMFLGGKLWAGIGILAWGFLVVANLDNFLRPYLVHRQIPMHQFIIFITMVGGIATFGFFGVLIGPVVAALLQASINVYREVFQSEPETV
jgi:predicted PurR-regulated permease PerM